MLTQAQIAHYLVAGGFSSAESIVEGDFEVLEASRRNSNFKVVSNRGPSYLLKQLKDASAGETLANEARVYRFLQEVCTDDTLLRYIPHILQYDSGQGMLVVELLRNSRDLYEHCDRFDRIPVRTAASLGRALSTLHRITGETLETAQQMGFTNHYPGVLYFHRPGVGVFRDTSSANLQLIRIVQSTPGFADHLDRLRESWRVDSMIHNDIKWENCVVSNQGHAHGSPNLKIVDWEFASLGDSFWDAGAVFSAFLGSWLLSVPVSGEDSPECFIELARRPLGRMLNSIHAFWSAYSRGRGFNRGESAQNLLRVIQFAAARLIQTAYERMQHSSTLSGEVVCLLQLSLNILQRPHEAAVQLLGLSTEF
jgi:aminoglycoside phosphotransferase (APT) family kinase protein